MTRYTVVELGSDTEAALGQLPGRAGVGQIRGPQGRNLVIGRPANLRRWAAAQLGRGRRAAKGRRPALDLSPLATAVAFAPSSSAFHQRVLFERLMARYVPCAERRDLKPPVYLRLDSGERFPRVDLCAAGSGAGTAFGPFRDRRSAERARAALQHAFALRPCDYVFEPDPLWAVGIACLHAQLRTCAAPCLLRISAEDYRSMAAAAAWALAHAEARENELALAIPPWVSRAGTRGLVVVSKGERCELYPVAGGAVLEEAALEVAKDELEAALGALSFASPSEPRDDTAWLTPWLSAPRRPFAYVVLRNGEAAASLSARVREVIP